MNLGKKKRSGKLIMSAIALMAVVAASLSGHTSPLRWALNPPAAAGILAQFQSQPHAAEAMLDRLPPNPHGVRLLMQLLSAPDGKAAKGARRTILMRLDELLVCRSASRHDELAVRIAAELQAQSRQARLPLGATDDLVARLLRWPPADAEQRAQIAAHCTSALRMTAEKHQINRVVGPE